MKRIYKNNDLAFNLTINNFPINKNLINSIEFRFYTLNNNNYISKSETDVDAYNQVILQWDELKKLEEGVLYYDYTVSLNNDDMVDGTQDTVTKKMTNYYIVTGIDNINIDNNNNGGGNNVDLSNYYTKNEVNNKLEGYVEDDVLGSYYTKNEVNELIDNIDIPTQEIDLSNYYTKTETYSQSEVNALIDGISAGNVELTNYYTKTEVDSMIPSTEGFITEIPSEYVTDSELTAKGYLTEHQSLDDYAKLTDIPSLDGYSLTSHTHEEYISSIPSEYITESELNDKGYLTQHQSLDNYYTKTEVDNKISASGNFDSTQYYTKTEVDAKIPTDYITSIPSEYITESELTAKGYLTEHQSLDGYAKLTDIPTDYIKTIPSEYITESELSTSLNGYSTTSHTHSEYITEQYDDTALANRVSALETELNGVSELITELNNMVV